MGVTVLNAQTRTVLFTDVRGSTAQRVLLGDDSFDALRREHDDVLTAAAVKNGGEIVKSTGDGLHITFRAASDAVACAVAMQRGIERLNRRNAEPEHLGLAVGVSAGDVIAEHGDVYGTAVVEAARLCAVALAGQVVVADVVRLLTGSRGGHDFQRRGDLALKGLAAPVRSFDVVWHAATVSCIPLPARLAPGLDDFVGRHAERTLLLDAFHAVAAGPREVVFVAGEPGIGKSRLAREAAATMFEEGAVVLAGRCEEHLGGPFQLWTTVLAHLIEHLDDDIVAHYLSAHGGEIARVLPDLRRRFPDLRVAPRVDADVARHRLFEATAALLDTATMEGPVVIVLDDLQWADVGSLQLLRHLVRMAPHAPILIIGTYRDTELETSPLDETLADLRRDDLFRRVVLQGLSTDELGEFLAKRIGSAPPPEFIGALSAETGGNPFFAGEVVAHLVESDQLGLVGEHWTTEISFDRLGMSEGVRDLLGRRMARLRRASTQALEIASVLGREFDVPTLALLDQVVEEELREYLEGALRAGLLRQDPSRPGRYAFTHALVRQRLYGGLGTTRRVRLHWQVGVALRAAPDHDVDAVAYHLSEGVLAGEAMEAVDATLVAAARALEVSAFETAVDQFGNAIALIDQADADDPDRRYSALVGLGDAHVALSNALGYTDAFLAAAEVARGQGRADRLARAALGIGQHALILRLAPETAALFDEAIDALGPEDSAARSMLLSFRAFHRTITPGIAEDRQAEIDEAAAIAARVGDRRAAAQAMFAQISALRGSPMVDRMIELSDAMLEAAIELDDIRLQTHALLNGATARLQRGDRAGWQRAAVALKLVARRPSGTYARPWSMMWDTVECVFDERYTDADDNASAGAATWCALPIVELCFVAQQAVSKRWMGQRRVAADLIRPWVEIPGSAVNLRTLLACFELDEAPDAARAVLDHCATDNFVETRLQAAQRPPVLVNLAELCVRTNSTLHAAAITKLVEPFSGQLLLAPVSFVCYQAADSALARLAALQGDRAAADDLFRRGIALEEQIGAKLLASASRLWFAEHLAGSSSLVDQAAARQLAQACLAYFESIGCYLTEHATRLLQDLVR
ncbi:MAG: AAA family ATPase [Ilumatobacteraceae bacterium]